MRFLEPTFRFVICDGRGFGPLLESKLLETDMEYTKPMLASSFDDYKHRLTYPVIVQPKLDGMRMMATVSNGQAIIYSRALKPFPAFEYASQFIVDSVPGNWILDGE